jgi:hypothetical protein
LQKNGILVSNSELLAIFRRADREEKHRITFHDFTHYIIPDMPEDKVFHEGTIKPFHTALIQDDLKNYELNIKPTHVHRLSPGYTSTSTKATWGYHNNYTLYESPHYYPSIRAQILTPADSFQHEYHSSHLKNLSDTNLENYSYLKNKLKESTSSLLKKYETKKRDVYSSYAASPITKRTEIQALSPIKIEQTERTYRYNPDTRTITQKTQVHPVTKYQMYYPYFLSRLPSYYLPYYYKYYPYSSDYALKQHWLKDEGASKTFTYFEPATTTRYSSPHYRGGNIPLRYSNYYSPYYHSYPAYKYRHEQVDDRSPFYMRSLYIPDYKPRSYWKMYGKLPTFYSLSARGKRYYAGDENIKYELPYEKTFQSPQKEQKDLTKSYFDDNGFDYQAPTKRTTVGRTVASLYEQSIISPEKAKASPSKLYDLNSVKAKYDSLSKEELYPGIK